MTAEPDADRERQDRSTRGEAWIRAWPHALCAEERARVAARRARVNAEAAGSGSPSIPDDAPEVGFGLSGGGIRAATFDLGVFQALARHRLIRRIDWLSTVSGGGYFGSFLGRLFSRSYASPDVVEHLMHPTAPGHATRDGSPDHPIRVQPLAWLRRHGRYMAPSGSGDLLMTAAVAIRNAVALHLMIALTVLLALLIIELPVIALEQWRGLQPLLASLPSLGQGLLGGSVFRPSPWLDLVPLLLAVLVVPAGWAYWLIEGRWSSTIRPVWGMVLIMVLSLVGVALTLQIFLDSGRSRPWPVAVALTTLVLSTLALIAYWRALDGNRTIINGKLDAHALYALSMARAKITASLARGMRLTALVAALGAFDTLGLSLYHAAVDADGMPTEWLLTAAAVLAPLATRLQSMRGLLERAGGSKWVSGLGDAAVTALAISAWLALFAGLSALAHGISAGFAPAADQPRAMGPVFVAIGLVGLLVVISGRTWTFVNRSSHASLYSARLTRAYLGASNPERHDAGRRASVQEPLLEDDHSIPGYHEGLLANGGPLHFINVTVNETATAQGRTVLRDRKGIGMAIGPAGVSAGVQHHARYGAFSGDVGWSAPLLPLAEPGAYSMFAEPGRDGSTVLAERMSLGQWIAVSGAAFSTGLGSRTTLGMSLLMGFANVRLGRWWDTGRDLSAMKRHTRSARLAQFFELILPVQTYLLDELTGSFHGPKRRHWYLTDGGHFENMGGYELIRRRLPMIVIVDAEEDAGFIYEGFAGLVRKARMDFGASIVPLDDAALDRAVHPSKRMLFGSLDSLRPDDARFSASRALLARVDYDDGRAPPSTLLYIKPTLRREDPSDLREYHAKNPAFPHQPTTDQFFDEAQWESYRKLGEVIGDALFAPVPTLAADDPRFVPNRLLPIDDAAIDAWQTRCRWQIATRLGDLA